MAIIEENTSYSYDREIKLGSVSPGHTVLLLDHSGVRDSIPYIVCKLGSTPLVKTTRDRKTIPLCNVLTGRIVLKCAIDKCNLVSHYVTMAPYEKGQKNA